MNYDEWKMAEQPDEMQATDKWLKIERERKFNQDNERLANELDEPIKTASERLNDLFKEFGKIF